MARAFSARADANLPISTQKGAGSRLLAEEEVGV